MTCARGDRPMCTTCALAGLKRCAAKVQHLPYAPRPKVKVKPHLPAEFFVALEQLRKDIERGKS